MVNNKSKKKVQRRANLNRINYTGGKPSKSSRGSVGFATSNNDINQVHAICNPFSPAARGSKLPDADSSKSVAISLVAKTTMSTGVSGSASLRIKPSLAETFSIGTQTGLLITAFAAPTALPDNTAIAAQFSKYRIVSFGVKVYSTLAPTAQSGYFSMITAPVFAANTNTGSSFWEEVLNYPTTETGVQWVSKPVGNQYLDYVDIADDASWDHLVVFASGLPISTLNAVQVEIFLNLECQVALGTLASAIATPAAPHRPHILSAVGEVHQKYGGSKLASAVKAGLGTYIKGVLSRAAQAGMKYLTGSMFPGANSPLPIGDFSHIPMVD